jgi:hypothetical protein
MDQLDILLDEKKDLDISAELAALIGKEVSKGKDYAQEYYIRLKTRLDNVLSSEASMYDVASIKKVFKIVQGICLLIACEPDENKQEELLNKALIRHFSQPNARHKYIYYLILCELAYLDQYLASFELRERLHTEMKQHLDQHIYAPSPILMDYDAAWRLLAFIRQTLLQYHDNKVDARLKLKSNVFQVTAVGSVKGGVGKSITAISLANFLLENDPDSRIALIDLDVSGPTLQFNLNISDIATALGTNPDRAVNDSYVWPYPTILDVDTVSHSASPSLFLQPANFGDQTLIGDPGRISVLTLPDSLTVTGTHVGTQYFERLANINILGALETIFDALMRQPFNVNHVVLDFGPGVFGTNGTLFKWLSDNYPTSLILMCSPRSFDIANSLYEGIWLSAKDFLPWHRNVLQMLNMWDPKEWKIGASKATETELDNIMANYINQYFDEVVTNDFSSPSDPSAKISSGKYIMFWRLRSYLYKIAMDQAEGEIGRTRSSINPLRYEIKTLPYDQDIRTLLHPSEIGLINFTVLRNSTWYSEFAKHMSSWLSGGGA